MSLANVFKLWKKSSFSIYKRTYEEYGGSICTHPDVISFLSNRKSCSLDFFHYEISDKIIAACFSFNGVVSHDISGYPFFYDDIIFPLSKGNKLFLPVKSKNLSRYHKGDFYNCNFLDIYKRRICLARSDHSAKNNKNRRNEYNKFVAAGGEIVAIDELTNSEICDNYIRLFNKRWEGSLTCYSRSVLLDVITNLKDMLFGYTLVLKGQPCAYDLIYRAVCNKWIYYDCHNGAYDPEFSNLSVGSVLMYKNLELARDECNTKEKEMIFSLGMDNPRWPYKSQWCKITSQGRTLI